MKYITLAIFFTFAFCLQHRSEDLKMQTLELHTHADDSVLLEEIAEFLYTGQFEHSHSHDDHDTDAQHTHSHSHGSPIFNSIVFIPAFFVFNTPIQKLIWPDRDSANLTKSYQSEILRPPIFSC